MEQLTNILSTLIVSDYVLSRERHEDGHDIIHVMLVCITDATRTAYEPSIDRNQISLIWNPVNMRDDVQNFSSTPIRRSLGLATLTYDNNKTNLGSMLMNFVVINRSDFVDI